MSGDNWLVALALLLVMEGLMPFLNPVAWRKLFAKLLAMSDGQLVTARPHGLEIRCVPLTELDRIGPPLP